MSEVLTYFQGYLRSAGDKLGGGGENRELLGLGLGEVWGKEEVRLGGGFGGDWEEVGEG